MKVAFNINALGMEGLGATLSSLVRHCSDTARLELHFLCSEVKERQKEDIESLLLNHQFRGTVHFTDFDAKRQFGHLRSLHGDWTPYGRLLIPRLFPTETVLYLDTDILVLLDVLELEAYDHHGLPLAAVEGGAARLSRDADFYLETLGFPPETKVFNSGVLLFNAPAWNETGVEDKSRRLSNAHADRLLSADQTLLNATFAGNFARLPERYNRRWSPLDDAVERPGNEIIHFVGSPKPWDLLGRRVHRGYDQWKRYNPVSWARKHGNLTGEKVYRTWKIKRSLARALVSTYLGR